MNQWRQSAWFFAALWRYFGFSQNITSRSMQEKIFTNFMMFVFLIIWITFSRTYKTLPPNTQLHLKKKKAQNKQAKIDDDILKIFTLQWKAIPKIAICSFSFSWTSLSFFIFSEQKFGSFLTLNLWSIVYIIFISLKKEKKGK